MRRIFLCCLLALPLALSGCLRPQGDNQASSAAPSPILTTIVEAGVISRKAGNIYEDGTHYLTTESGKQFLLKSSTVDLSSFEEDQVTITGETPAGKSDAMPLVTVFAVDRHLAASVDRQSLFHEETLGFAISLPGDWQRRLEEGRTAVVYFPEGAPPVIRVQSLAANSAEAKQLLISLAEGTEVTIGGKPGLRLLKNGGQVEIAVSIPESGRVISFTLTPGNTPEKEKIVFYEMLTGLKWTIGLPKNSSAVPVASPAAACGGSAKKLCPQGFRCELSGMEKDAEGVCVDADMPPSDITKQLSGDRENLTNTIPQITKPAAPSPMPSPVPSPLNSSAALVAPSPDAGYARYEQAGMQFSYALPRSWWWRNLGARDGAQLRIEASNAEVTDENWLVAIEVVAGAIGSPAEGQKNGLSTISVPRDGTSHFVVSGKSGHQGEINKIASSLFSF